MNKIVYFVSKQNMNILTTYQQRLGEHTSHKLVNRVLCALRTFLESDRNETLLGDTKRMLLGMEEEWSLYLSREDSVYVCDLLAGLVECSRYVTDNEYLVSDSLSVLYFLLGIKY